MPYIECGILSIGVAMYIRLEMIGHSIRRIRRNSAVLRGTMVAILDNDKRKAWRILAGTEEPDKDVA